MKLENGYVVIYKPTHANDFYHKDCEIGVVFESHENSAFVRYFRNGMLQHTAQMTNKFDMKIISFKGNFNFSNIPDYALIEID